MDIEKLKDIFRKHVEKYDMNDQAIMMKFNHSYRVMELCMLLAKYHNFDERDMEIAILVGLLHDYARFEQWAKYGTFSDLKSIDHGDLAVERLFDDNEIIDYCTNREYYDEIYDGIKYHNKYGYSDDLSVHNKLICRVIRDADKLDIFYLLGINKNLMQEDNEDISDKIKQDFYSNKPLSRLDVRNKSDNILLSLAMVFDLEFDYSYKHIYDFKLIDKMFENIEDKVKFKPYFNYINRYIENKVK